MVLTDIYFIYLFFSLFVITGAIKNSYIRRYEPAWYDAALLRRQRVRRDASSEPPRDQPLILRVRALDK